MNRLAVFSIIIIGLSVTLISFDLNDNLLRLDLEVTNRFPFSVTVDEVTGTVYAEHGQVVDTIGYIFADTPVEFDARDKGKLTLYVALESTPNEFRALYDYNTVFRAKVTVTLCRGYICIPIPIEKEMSGYELEQLPIDM